MINCSDMNYVKSSVYYYKLEIYDRLSLIFVKEIELSLFDLNGVLGEEIKWDGTFNGVPVSPGTYTWKATVKSCFDGSGQCNDCSLGSEFQKCGTSGEEIFTGAIDVLL